MKSLLSILLLVLIGQCVFGQTYFGPNYQHWNSSSNCEYNYNLLDNTMVGNNAADNLIFTHVWGVSDYTHQEYMTKSAGLWFEGTAWSIFNEDWTIDMDTNLAFNVLNPQVNGNSFRHTVTVDNSANNGSNIDNPLLNGNPNAVFFLTKTWDNGVYDTAHVGIWYNSARSKWAIYNENYTGTLQLNSTYNIFIPDAGTSFFKHSAIDSYYITYLDNPLLNGHPDAKIFVVHDYTNDVGHVGYVNDEIGVWYDEASWSIYTENITDLFAGATFNVLVIADYPTGVSNVSNDHSKLKVFPNPANNKVHVLVGRSLTGGQINLTLSTIEGQILIQQDVDGKMGQYLMDVANIPTGIYILTAIAGKGTYTTKVNILR